MMERLLLKYGDAIDVVYAHNADIAIGAIQAIEAFGFRPGHDMKIISIDATNKAFECNPLLGPQIMQASKELVAGKEIPMKITTSEETFKKEEARQEMRKKTILIIMTNSKV
ncbi:hypothetical protein MUN88_21390 [Gracilibacillus caseinilyticus]|uniref:Periplasmic binding protein domain-containing protein n=1 Tax=Gracilibacillus caseinilyticus TaxID=2932256 RepID=A0ABY4EVX5_9BACI|nr:hypothetical protein [Gracilibacillus caseinilyticus]UOQ48550.1 hypothetical protein MUN88_21390 [Gracilibacillus caseinilyticus]